MKNTILFIAALVIALTGCTSEQLQKDQAWLVAAAPQVVAMVDLGLTVSGNGELAPINNAGVAALNALRLSFASKNSITPDAIGKLATVADLGLQATNKGELVSVNDEMAADLAAGVMAAQIATNVTPTKTGQ